MLRAAVGGKKKKTESAAPVRPPWLSPTAFKFLSAADCAPARVPVDVGGKIDPRREETDRTRKIYVDGWWPEKRIDRVYNFVQSRRKIKFMEE